MKCEKVFKTIDCIFISRRYNLAYGK